jgi:hypothetical protein
MRGRERKSGRCPFFARPNFLCDIAVYTGIDVSLSLSLSLGLYLRMDCNACHIFTHKIGRHLNHHQHARKPTEPWHRLHFRPYPLQDLLKSFLYPDLISVVQSYLCTLFVFQACPQCHWCYLYQSSTEPPRRKPLWYALPPEAYATRHYTHLPLQPKLFPGDVIEIPLVFSFRDPSSISSGLKQKTQELMGMGALEPRRCGRLYSPFFQSEFFTQMDLLEPQIYTEPADLLQLMATIIKEFCFLWLCLCLLDSIYSL